MRVFLQVFIPFGIFVAVLLTPIYLQRDFEKNESDAIFDPHTGGSQVTDATTSADRMISEMTTAFATKAITTTLKNFTAETTRTSAYKTTTTTETSTTATMTITTTTTTTTTTTINTTTKTTTSTTTSTTTTTQDISTTATITTTPTTTTKTTTTTSTTTTTTTTEQDKDDPCPFQCSNHGNCKLIVGDIPITPRVGRDMGTLVASKQFRLNIGIDFPSDAAIDKYNLVHERALFTSSASLWYCHI